eukprot:g1580.t1
MLMCFFLASFAQGVTWTPLSAIPASAKAFFPVLTDADIFWSLNCAVLVYLPFSFIIAPRVLQRGVHKSVRTGVSLTFCCAALRLIAGLSSVTFRGNTGCNALLLIAAACCGAAGSFTQGATGRFAALWFPEREQARATAVGDMGTYLGTAASYLIAPAVVRGPADFPALLWLELAIVGLPFVLIIAHFPPRGPGPAGDAGGDGAAGGWQSKGQVGSTDLDESFVLLEGLRLCKSSGKFLLLMLSAGLLHGLCASWGASLALVLGPGGVRAGTADAFSCCYTCFYLAGMYVVDSFTAGFFNRRLKMLVCLLVVLSASTLACFGLSVPLSQGSAPLLSKILSMSMGQRLWMTLVARQA